MILAFLSGMDVRRRIVMNVVIIAAAVGITYAIGLVTQGGLRDLPYRGAPGAPWPPSERAAGEAVVALEWPSGPPSASGRSRTPA